MRDTGEETLESMGQAIWYNNWTMKKIVPYLKSDVLEVGCGIGNFTRTLTDYGRVWAIDIKESYISQLKKSAGSKMNVGLGDIEKGKYFFDKRKFNSIVCLNVLEHIDNDNQALKNLYQLLSSNGVLIMIVPSHPFLYGSIDRLIGHYRRYTKEDVGEKLKLAGFNIIKSRRLNFLGAIGWFISGKILKEEKVKEGKIKLFNILAPFILPIEDWIEPLFGTSILVIAQKSGGK